MQALIAGKWVQDWPLSPETLQPVADTFATSSDEPLTDAWQRLFIGPYALPAPPWGSVWLDRESVLFGDSTLALRQWMRENGIAFEMQQNEPEDHFGTLLLLAAWLIENAAIRSATSSWRGTCCRGVPASCRYLSTMRVTVLHRAGQACAADAGGLAIHAGYPCCGKDAVSLRDVACSRLAGKPG